jgi:hypothetical protein
VSFVLSALGLGRRMAAQRFTETVTFFTVARDQDENLQPIDVETVVAANVPARVKVSSSVVSEKSIAGQAPATMQREVHVPVGSVSVGASVSVRVTASTADPGMVGRVFLTGMRSGVGQVTVWRYPVTEVS